MDELRLNLAEDTKNILETLLNSEEILRFLTISPTNNYRDVLLIDDRHPSIVQTKSLEQRYYEFYLGDDPIFINWSEYPQEELDRVQGRICFYPPVVGLSGCISPTSYIVDMYIPYNWHRFDSRAFRLIWTIGKLFKDTNIFGDVGMVNGKDAIKLPNIRGWVGYRIEFRNHNFVK